MHWGRIFWNFIHTIARYFQYANKNPFVFHKLMEYVDANIPCTECKTLILNELRLHPLYHASDLFEWSVRLHNEVNRTLNKPIVSMQEAQAIWDHDLEKMLIAHTWNLMLYCSCYASFNNDTNEFCHLLVLLAIHILDAEYAWVPEKNDSETIEDHIKRLVQTKYTQQTEDNVTNTTLVRSLVNDLEEALVSKFSYLSMFKITHTIPDAIPVRAVMDLETLAKLNTETRDPIIKEDPDDAHEHVTFLPEEEAFRKIQDLRGHHDVETQMIMDYEEFFSDNPILTYDPIITYNIIIPFPTTIHFDTITNNTDAIAYAIHDIMYKTAESFEYRIFNFEIGIYGFDIDPTLSFDVLCPAGCESAYHLKITSDECHECLPHPGIHAHPHKTDELPDTSKPLRAGFTCRIVDDAPSIVVFIYVLKEMPWEDFVDWFKHSIRVRSDMHPMDVILSFTTFRCRTKEAFHQWSRNLQTIEDEIDKIKLLTPYAECTCAHTCPADTHANSHN